MEVISSTNKLAYNSVNRILCIRLLNYFSFILIAFI